MDDIVKASGIARGTFYLYFKDKSDLIEQLLFFKSAENLKAVMAKTNEQAQQCADLTAYARAFLNFYIDFLCDQKEALAVVQKNISACMRYFPDFFDEEAKALYMSVVENFVRGGYAPDEIQKRIFIVVEMIGSVGADAVLYGSPYDIESIRPSLVEAALHVLLHTAAVEGGAA